MSTSYLNTKKLVTLAILSALGIPLMYISVGPVPAAPWLKFDFSDLVVYIAAVIYGPVGALIVAFIKSVADFFLKGSEVGIPINQLIAFISSLAFVLPFYYTMVFVQKMIKLNNKISKTIGFALGVIFLTLALSYITSIWIAYIVGSKLQFNIPEQFNLWMFIMFLPIFLLFTVVTLPILAKQLDIKNEVIIRLVPLLIGTLSLTILLTFLNYVLFTPLYLKLLGWDLPQPFLNYVISIYGPFNFAKGIILSSIFFLLSFRLENIAEKLNIIEKKEYRLIFDK